MVDKAKPTDKKSRKKKTAKRSLTTAEMLTKFKLVHVETDPEMQNLANETGCMYMAIVAPTMAAAASANALAQTPMISDDEVIEVDYMLSSLREKIEFPNCMRLALETPGGLPAAAYKIALALRRNFEKLTIYVPFTAYSAGTLIALAADEVVMGQMSNLGPLDVQVPGKDGVYVSGSAFRKAMEWMNGMQKERGDKATLDSVLKWIDPIMLRSFEDLQKASENYLREILTEAKYTPEAIQQIATALVWDLPTHEFAILRDMAIDLGIKVGRAEDHKEWGIIRDWVIRLSFSPSEDHILAYVAPHASKKKK